MSYELSHLLADDEDGFDARYSQDSAINQKKCEEQVVIVVLKNISRHDLTLKNEDFIPEVILHYIF